MSSYAYTPVEKGQPSHATYGSQGGISNQQPGGYHVQAQPVPPNGYTQDVIYGEVVEGDSLYGVQEGSAKKFVVNGYKDVWCAVVFLLVFLGCLVYGAYNLGTDPILREATTDATDSGGVPRCGPSI